MRTADCCTAVLHVLVVQKVMKATLHLIPGTYMHIIRAHQIRSVRLAAVVSDMLIAIANHSFLHASTHFPACSLLKLPVHPHARRLSTYRYIADKYRDMFLYAGTCT